jgi:hypothetical protein
MFIYFEKINLIFCDEIFKFFLSFPPQWGGFTDEIFYVGSNTKCVL